MATQGQYRFTVPSELSPGVFRAGVGFFAPGETVRLPDENSARYKKQTGEEEKWPWRLVPQNEESYQALKKQHPGKSVKRPPSRAALAAAAQAQAEAAAAAQAAQAEE